MDVPGHIVYGRDLGKTVIFVSCQVCQFRRSWVSLEKLGAVDFFIGGDINFELKLELGDEDLQGLDGIDWYGTHGRECLGGGEDVITYEKKLRWLQLLRLRLHSQAPGRILRI